LFLPPNSWSDNFAAYAPLADAMRLLGRGQRLLYPGRPERGKVAIHLPASSRLWDRQMFASFGYREALPLHTALVHDGYAVDLVDDAAIHAGALVERGYTTLYLLGPNLLGTAQRHVANWVRAGGTLVVLPGAATADEADMPTALLDDVLGVGGRAGWSEVREPAHATLTSSLSNRLEATDPVWRERIGSAGVLLRDLVANPTQARLADFPTYVSAGAQAVARMQPISGSGAARPAIFRNRFGAGVAYTYAFFPGWQYMATATHPTTASFQDRLPRNWSEADRLLATLPARLANTPRSVQLSHSAVEARRLQSDAGIAVVLFNWTGAPLPEITAVVRDARPFPRVTSLRHGPLLGQAVDGANLRVTLPLDNVDVLLFEP
jgi:hypothetical protein